MGDDLNFAQKFTRTAADGLALLAEMPDPRAHSDAPVVINMMTTVQRGAKRLRARNIYVGAQNVLSALHHENDAVLTGRIETLGSLVTAYARGLDELLTETAPAIRPARTTADKWDMARETLNDLLPSAPPEQADMLSRLMRAPVTLETVQPEADVLPITSDAEIVAFPPINALGSLDDKIIEEDIASNLDVDLDLTSNLEADDLQGHLIADAPTSKLAPATAPDLPNVALEALMRDIIADALSVARSIGRTISLSYDMGDRTVTSAIADDLRVRVGSALSQIIRQALTDDRVGHIDINLAGQQLHIMAGTTAMRVAIDPKTSPAAKKLITVETEQGLRAQLDALMDPISFHETAS